MGNTYYFYTKRPAGKKNKLSRRVTVAGVVVDNTLKIGIATCSTKDQFTKKEGRLIATGRANKKPIHTVKLTDNQVIGKVFLEAVNELI